MGRLLMFLLVLFCHQVVNAATYDFSGATPLSAFNHDGNSYQVANQQLVPPLVSDFYNNGLTLKNQVSGGAGNTISLTADFLYDTSLINPNPAEVPGLSLFVNAGSSDARGEMRALGIGNTDVVAYAVAYDVNSRNLGNPTVNLQDDTWYRLAFGLQLIGGQFNDKQNLTTELFKLGGPSDELVSTFSVDSYDFRMLQPSLLTVGLNAQRSSGIAAVDNFTVSVVPIPPAVWLFGTGIVTVIALCLIPKRKRGIS